MNNNIARLLVSGVDKPGIVAQVSGFFAELNLNIIELAQHATKKQNGIYFSRLEFSTDNLNISRQELENIFETKVAKPNSLKWSLHFAKDIKNIVIMVSKYDHALLELLWKHNKGELPCNITKVISNHRDLEQSVEHFGIEYHYVPVTSENKEESENIILELIKNKTDLIVLARYMQILSGKFISQYNNKIINIHHSFLPAFAGAKPYHQAFDKGVKLIGATAHYATTDLDEGPIIEQDVARVSHEDSVQSLTRLGHNIERTVLAKAVTWHLEDRIIVNDNKTIVFK